MCCAVYAMLHVLCCVLCCTAVCCAVLRCVLHVLRSVCAADSIVQHVLRSVCAADSIVLHACPAVWVMHVLLWVQCSACVLLRTWGFQFCVHVVWHTCWVLTTDGCELGLQPQLFSRYAMFLLQHLYRCADKVLPAECTVIWQRTDRCDTPVVLGLTGCVNACRVQASIEVLQAARSAGVQRRQQKRQ